MSEFFYLIRKICNKKYQFKYDRLFIRKFDNQKTERFTKITTCIDVYPGLKSQMGRFLDKGYNFNEIIWRIEGTFEVPFEKIKGWKNITKYFYYR